MGNSSHKPDGKTPPKPKKKQVYKRKCSAEELHEIRSANAHKCHDIVRERYGIEHYRKAVLARWARAKAGQTGAEQTAPEKVEA